MQKAAHDRLGKTKIASTGEITGFSSLLEVY